MINAIIGLLIAALIIGAIIKVVTDKKRGVMCSGCPQAKQCAQQLKSQSPFPIASKR